MSVLKQIADAWPSLRTGGNGLWRSIRSSSTVPRHDGPAHRRPPRSAAFADTVESAGHLRGGRKDAAERAKAINSADLAFLCLPDAASIEVLPLLCGKKGRRHLHGIPHGAGLGLRLSGAARRQRAALKRNRIAVPGCHASGFISIARPLVELGLAGRDYPFTCHSLTGSSGGGKKMIAEYEAAARPAGYAAPRAYGLNLHHKHLPPRCALFPALRLTRVLPDRGRLLLRHGSDRAAAYGAAAGHKPCKSPPRWRSITRASRRLRCTPSASCLRTECLGGGLVVPTRMEPVLCAMLCFLAA